jgi:hypothetical protein
MSSRREQKDQLRREREAREAAQHEGQRRRQLIGYGVGGGIVVVAVIVAIALLAGGGGGGSSASADVLPDGGSVPAIDDQAELAAAAKAAGCELKSYKATGRKHTADLSEKIKYASNPPTSGNHYQEWAEDGAYEDPPDIKMLVHALEHGRIVIWVNKKLPSEQRANIKAYYDEDTYQMLITPDTSGMTYDVALSAWSREPEPNGTGRLLGCPKYDDAMFTAFEAFKDEHRSRGPEPVP